MPLSRRTLIAASGTGLALVATAGFWRVSRAPETALQPWTLQPPLPSDPRLDALRHAILAPNPHNRQPWIIRLDGSDSATLFCDLDRRLLETDPFDRQVTIGFGCFLELARIAAAERGFRIDQSPFPDGKPRPRLDARPVARLSFVADPDIRPDPLFPFIAARRSTKTVFDARPVEPEKLQRLIASVDPESTTASAVLTETEPTRVAAIRKLVLEAVDIEMHAKRPHQESVDLMRIGAREVDANPDGIALVGPGIEAMAAAGIISRAALADPESTAFRQGAAMMAETYGSAPAFLLIRTLGNSRADQLLAGHLYARANLAATSLGLAMHPMSQSLQEYPAMADVFARMQALLRPVSAPGTPDTPSADNARVQMLARIGYAAPVPPSPRWPLSAKLIRPS